MMEPGLHYLSGNFMLYFSVIQGQPRSMKEQPKRVSKKYHFEPKARNLFGLKLAFLQISLFAPLRLK